MRHGLLGPGRGRMLEQLVTVVDGVGRRGEDATCLRVAQAYESAVGGFPAPPGR